MVRHYMTVDEIKKRKEMLKYLENSGSGDKVTEEIEKFEEIHRIQLNQLNITQEKIEVMKRKRNQIDSILKDMNLKMKKIEETIENTCIISAIIVRNDDMQGSNDRNVYDLLNGFLGLNRDVIMKLLRLIKSESKKRNIMGMMENIYLWSKRPIFRWVQMSFTEELLYPTAEDRYEGSVCRGVPHGWGVCVLADGHICSGNWVKGRMNGKGTVTWQDGSKYTGELLNNVRSGTGIYTYPSGQCAGVYDGSWKECVVNVLDKKNMADWIREGKGTMLYFSYGKYEGDWVDNEMEGEGVFVWNNGNVYSGQLKDGVRNGKGCLVCKNGYKYEGEWRNDHAEGEGVLTDPKGKVIFKGQWKKDIGYEGTINKEGKHHGKGVMVYGGYYEGDLMNGKKEGTGTMVFANGDKYEGEWVNDLREGDGVYVWKEGSVCSGQRKKGKMNGRGTKVYASARECYF